MEINNFALAALHHWSHRKSTEPFPVQLFRHSLLFPLAFTAGLVWADPAPDAGRQAELIRLVRQDCGSCHGMTLNGGLGPALTAQALRDKPLEAVYYTILGGRPGTAMPAWKTILNEADADWIARRLMEGFPEETRAQLLPDSGDSK